MARKVFFSVSTSLDGFIAPEALQDLIVPNTPRPGIPIL